MELKLSPNKNRVSTMCDRLERDAFREVVDVDLILF